MTQPKILLLDIETAPKLAYVWGLWDQNVGLNQLVSDTYVLCWSAKWLGSNKIMSDSLHAHKAAYKKDPQNDKEILKGVWKLLDEADIIVAHNGDGFDIPVLNGRFLEQGMGPPSSCRSVDTLKIARRKFKLTSNKLDFLAQTLKLGKKLDTGGFSLWADVVGKRDKKAFDRMVEYCRQDTLLLEKVYYKLGPWDEKHPSTVILSDLDKPRCNVCGSENVIKKGSYATNTQIYQKYRCTDCGHSMRSRRAEKMEKEQKANLLRSI